MLLVRIVIALKKKVIVVIVVLCLILVVGGVFYYAASFQNLRDLPMESTLVESQPEQEPESQPKNQSESQQETNQSQQETNESSLPKLSIVVPDDYPTVADAIGNATEGASIHVRAGIYEGPQNQTLVINKTLTISGEGALSTRINMHPALVNQTIFTCTFVVPSTAITIDSNNVRLTGFKIVAPGGISVNGEDNEIADSVIEQGDLRLSGSRLTFARSTVKNSGLTLVGSGNNIVGNTINGGIEFKGSFNNLTGNTINSDINLNGSSNTISGNIFPAMYMDSSNFNTINNNTFRCIWLGLYGQACSNNTIFRNLVKGPGIWGILMGDGSYNVFYENYITDFTGSYSYYGVAIGGNHQLAEYNTFYRNTFINNNRNVGWNWDMNGKGNFWDNDGTGNYWSDYTGKDENGDGVGDTPYVINNNNIDNHPLMTPYKYP